MEIDVRMLADDTVVVFHDKDLKRVANDPRYLATMNKSDLATTSLMSTPSTFQRLHKLWILLPDGYRC